MAESLVTFYVPDLHCGGCVKRFTKAMDVEKTQQEYHFQCDPLKRQVTFELETVKNLQALKQQMFEAGFPAYVLVDSKKHQKQEQRDFLKRIFVSVIGMMQVMMLTVAIYLEIDMPIIWIDVFHWFSLFVTTPVMLYAGKPYFVSAAGALMRRQVNMEVPISLALIVAYIYSFVGLIHGVHTLYFDSINMFLFFITLGRFAEWKARYKTTEASEALWADIPQTVTLVTETGDKDVSLVEIKPKQIVRVKLGSQISVDGIITAGESLIDESMLTGESEPVLRHAGDKVYAGTVNQTQAICVQATAVQGATQLGHIQRLLFEAQESKPRLAKYADKIAGYFIARLLLLSLIVGLYWYFIDASKVIPVLVSLLIVTCPCALSLATPAAIAAALARLTQHGIVVSKGEALETAGKVDHFIFDKTGTLTESTFEINEVLILGSQSREQVLGIAAALEATTEHPIGKAFLRYNQGITASDIKVLPGVGLEGAIDNKLYIIGAPDIVVNQLEVREDFRSANRIKSQLESEKCSGTLLVLMEYPSQPLAIISLKSTMRAHAKEVLQELRPAEMTLLSGDHENAVAATAKSLSIPHWFSRATPASKQAHITNLQSQGACVLMVGDGVNDGPVLAQADIGVTLGQGTALAKSSADVILMHDELKGLTGFLKMSNATRKIIRENMIWAVVYNAIAIPFASAGMVPPWLAAIGMSMSSLLVVLNSLRLLKLNIDSD